MIGFTSFNVIVHRRDAKGAEEKDVEFYFELNNPCWIEKPKCR